jgi:hypothetical protein
VALARYGIELDDDGTVWEGAPAPIRILAAIAGIPEERFDHADEDDA